MVMIAMVEIFMLYSYVLRDLLLMFIIMRMSDEEKL